MGANRTVDGCSHGCSTAVSSSLRKCYVNVLLSDVALGAMGGYSNMGCFFGWEQCAFVHIKPCDRLPQRGLLLAKTNFLVFAIEAFLAI